MAELETDEPPESMPVEAFFKSSAPEPDEPPESIPAGEFFKGAETASRPGAFARGAAEGVIPAAAGLGGGLLAGAGTGALMGSAVGPWGTLAGGVIGGLITGYGASKLQEAGLEASGLREGEGWLSRKQKETDEALFPYSRAAGGIAAAAPGLRFGGNLLERGISGVIGGAGEAVSDYASTGHVDPLKVGMGVAGGVAMPNINKPFSSAVSRVAPRSLQPHLPNFDPKSRATDVPENYLPRAPEENYLPRAPEENYLPRAPEQQGPPQPPPERMAEVENLTRQMEMADRNRSSYQPDANPLDKEMHARWDTHYNTLAERRAAIVSGKYDVEVSPQGHNPVTPEQQAKINNPPGAGGGLGTAPTAAKMDMPAAGNEGFAAGSKHVADGAVDKSKTAVRTAPGEPTVPSKPVDTGPIASDIQHAMAAKGERKVGPTPEEEAAATAQGRAQAEAQPTPSGERLEREFPKVAQPGEQPKPFTEQQRGRAPEAQPVAKPGPEEAYMDHARQQHEQQLAKIAANEKRMAELEARLAQNQAPPEPAVTAPVTPPRAVPPELGASTPAPRQATLRAPEGARAAVEGRRPTVAEKAPVEPRLAAEPVAPKETVAGFQTAKPYVTPDIRPPVTAQPAVANQAKPKLGLKQPRGPAETAERLRGRNLQEFDNMQLGRIAQSLQRSGIGDKPTLIKRIQKALDDLRKAEEGSIDIGPATREPIREKSVAQMGEWWAPHLPAKALADTVLAAADGNPRYALTLINRRMTERRGEALRRNVIEARDMLAEQAEAIPARAEPSPEVPVVPGKTIADLKPRKTELIPAKREYTPPGKRTPQKVIDPITGEVRDTMVLRKPPPKLMEGYTPEEKGRVIDAIDALPEEQRMDAYKRTIGVPKEEILANLDKIAKSAAEAAQDERKLASRKTITGAGGRSIHDKLHKEGILAAYEKAYVANPPPEGRTETVKETVERAKNIVKAVDDEVNRFVAESTRDYPKAKHIYTGAYDTAHMANPPPAAKVVNQARVLLRRPWPAEKLKFDTEELLARSPGAEPQQRKGGLTGGEPEPATPAAEVMAGPRYEPRVYPDEPMKTSDHADLVNMLNGMSDRAHDMMQEAYKGSIEHELAKKNANPAALRTELLDALIAAQDRQNKFSHALPGETLVKTTSVRDRAGIAEVEQTGRFKPTKTADYRYLTKADREKTNAKVYGPETEYYQQIAPVVLAHFGKGKETAARLARGEMGGDETTKGLEASGRLLGKIPGPYEKKPNWMAKLLGDVANDKNGSLDVTKIFSWIDKFEKKFRPDREPMTPIGMTRLYRAETVPSKEPGTLPDWLADHPTVKATMEANGRWFAPSLEEARWYVDYNKRNTDAPSIIKYVDVPTAVVDQYRVDNLTGVEGKAAQRFSSRWDKEFFLPREIADQRVPYEPQDLSLTDHMRKLWGDENGALDLGKIKNWLPNARSRARSEFDPTATEQTKNYAASIVAGDKFGERVIKLRNEADNLIKDLHYNGVKAGVRPAAEVEEIGRAIVNRTESALTPSQRKWKEDHLDPLHKEYNERFIRVRDLATELGIKHDMPEPIDNGPGYIRHLPRREVRTAEDVEAFDPRFTNTNPLGIEKPALKERGWFALQEDGTKAREFYHLNDKGNMVVMKDGVAGQVYRPGNNPGNFPETFKPGQVGQRWGNKLVDNVTIDEIMRHGRGEPAVPGGDPVKLNYERNPMFVLGTANRDLIYAETRLKFLKELVNNPDFQQNVTGDRAIAAEKWGDKNIKQTILEGSPFHNKWFPKPVAFALDDLVKQGFNYSGNTALEAISRFNQAALKPFYFLGPVVHPLNEADKLIIGRGYDNFNPSKTWRNFKKGLASVREQGDVMTEIMEGGGNPMFLHALVSRFEQNYAKSLGVELAEKAWKYDPLFAKAGINTKAKYWEPAYQGSNKGMWWSTDVMYSMLYHDMKDRLGGGYKNWEKKAAELEKLNKIEKPTAEQVRQRDELTTWTKELARKSVIETEKIIDGYTMPSTIGKSFGLEGTDTGRLAQQLVTDPLTANFGRYSYGLIKTLVNIGKNMAGKNENLSAGQSAALGFSQAATMMGMISLVYPALSAAYAMTPWAKPESEFELRGVSRVAALVPETAHKGIKDTYGKIAARALSPSVGLNYGLTTFQNRDNVGRPIMESAGPGGWGAVPFQAAGHAFDQFISPAGQVSRAYAQEGGEFAAKRFLESQVGLRTPSDAQVRYEAKRQQTDIRQGRAREKHPRGVFDIVGNEARKLVRGYEKGGVVTATETEGDSTPGGFDPEGDDYDYQTATDAGMGPGEDNHWSSREPKSGVLLKGRSHPTFDKTIKGEEEAGYEIYKKGSRYYSREKGVIPTSND